MYGASVRHISPLCSWSEFTPAHEDMSPEQLSSQASGFLFDFLPEYLGTGPIEAECGVVLTLWYFLSLWSALTPSLLTLLKMRT